ncbi:MAG TPA: PH domain-containing protein [Pirellulales bacterium]|nr:PH domain-containing protein [Pirellulales bacterium]
MQCPACHANAPDHAKFCPQCGKSFDDDRSPAVSAADSPGIVKSIDLSEHDVWHGRYSPKAMIGTWVFLAVVSVVALAVAVFVQRAEAWWVVGLGLPLLWLSQALRLAYRRISVQYRLTNLWFEYKSGVLSRTIHRMDVIDMEDLQVEQSPIERMTGVGTIRIFSSDRTDPELRLIGIENVAAVSKQFDQVRLAQRRRRSLRVEGGMPSDIDAGHHV